MGHINVLYGVSGSVAAIKIPEILSLIRRENYSIILVFTKSSMHFLNPGDCCKKGDVYRLQNERGYPHGECVYFEDVDEWASWSKRGDPVLHILLRQWATIFVIAPLSANTMASAMIL
ncbi:hypothetical protein ACOME3_007576 [Neoechinorhynchus agilis]